MKTEYLEEFIALAVELNFSKVAREMNSSASALSKHMSALEKDLGKKLFNRSTTKVALTDEGRAFYEGIAPIMDQFAAFTEGFRAKRPSSHNRLLIAFNMRTPGIVGAAMAAAEALEAARGVKVSFQNAGEESYYTSPELRDANGLITFVSRQVPSNMRFFVLEEDPFVVVVRSDHPLARQDVVSLAEDLSRYRIIRLKGGFFRPGQDAIMDAFEDAGVVPQTVYSLASSLDDLGLLMNSREAIILPKSAVSHLRIDQSEGHKVLPFAEDLSFKLSLVYPEAYESENLRAFAEAMAKRPAAERECKDA